MNNISCINRLANPLKGKIFILIAIFIWGQFIFSSSILAQPSILDNADIMGITLKNDRTEIKSILEKNYKITDSSENKQKFKLNNIETDEIPLTLHFEVQDKADENNPLGDLSELFVLALDPTPDSKSILGIERYYSFPRGKKPLKKVFIKSIIDKYGKPQNYQINTNTYYWTDGALDYTSWVSFVKFTHSMAYHGHVVWYDGYLNLDKKLCATSEAEDFLNTIRAVMDDRNNTLSKRQTFMELTLVPNEGSSITDNDEISAFSISLVNVSKSVSALKSIINDATAKDQQLRQEELNQKERNKAPKL